MSKVLTLVTTVLTLAGVLLTSGCTATAQSSWRYDEASVAKIVEGRTTEAEAVTLLGEPTHVVEQAGRRTLMWADVTTQNRGPTYFSFGHEADFRTQMRSLTLHIDNGIVAKKETGGVTSRLDAKGRTGF